MEIPLNLKTKRANKTRMINCLPVPSRKFHDNSTINPEIGARCRQAVTSLGRWAKKWDRDG